MQRYEYGFIDGCCGGGIEGHDPSHPSFTYLSLDGAVVTSLEKSNKANRVPEWRNATEREFLNYFIAYLGAEGWEMVGMMETQDIKWKCLWFKRPIPE